MGCRHCSFRMADDVMEAAQERFDLIFTLKKGNLGPRKYRMIKFYLFFVCAPACSVNYA